MWAFVRELQADGTTILLTTQYLEEADQLADQITVIDVGKVIAEGTSDQLKDQIGGEVLELNVEDTAQTWRGRRGARRASEPARPNVDVDEGRIRVPVGNEGAEALRDSSRRLDEQKIKLAGFAVHRPTLDDVFLALTGPRRRGRRPSPSRSNREARPSRPEGEGMSATIARSPTARRAPSTVGARISRAINNGLIVAHRNIVTLTRVPTVFIFELVQPIMFVLLFRFIYANNIANLPAGFDYVLFLMPGIFIQNAIFGATTTAIGLAEDMKEGIIDRFRSLPMARSAVLVGRTTFDLAKNLILVAIVLVIGYLVGFRFSNGFVNALWMLVLVMAVGFTFSWISACVGLSLKKVEAVQAASFTWIFPIVFVSSAFVPVVGMAPFLQVIARNNPVTHWCNLARYLAVGPGAIVDPQTHLPVDTFHALVFLSVAWIVGLLLIFVPLSTRLYRRLT